MGRKGGGKRLVKGETTGQNLYSQEVESLIAVWIFRLWGKNVKLKPQKDGDDDDAYDCDNNDNGDDDNDDDAAAADDGDWRSGRKLHRLLTLGTTMNIVHHEE